MAARPDLDAALMQAYGLAIEDHTDEVLGQLERLIPVLVEAGYAAADNYTWNFTPEGVARVKELEGREGS